MLFINAYLFVVLQWHLLYTLTLSSPLTPPQSHNLISPTNNSLILPMNLSLLLTPNPQHPPTDPYTLGPRGSSTYVSFTTYGESIPFYTMTVILEKMTNDLHAHMPQDRDKSMSFKERDYSSKSLGAKLTLETGFVADMTWGQWRDASWSIQEFYMRFGGCEFEFEVFSRPKQFLASGALVKTI